MTRSRPDRDALDEIRRLYYEATGQSIQRDLERAIDIFKTLTSDEQRERGAVYMDGLSQMRSEWAARSNTVKSPGPRASGKRPPGGRK
jgi:hypothetical protein